MRKSYLIPITANPDPDNSIILVRGEGDKVWDKNGKEYLDFSSGYGIGILGHRNPKITDAKHSQEGQIEYTSTLHSSLAKEDAAEALALYFDPEGYARVYFDVNGSMANEGICKIVAESQHRKGNHQRTKFLVFKDAFSGRTSRCLSIADSDYNRRDFNIEDQGNEVRIPFNDIPAFLRAIKRPDIAGVFMEPIQGEGGINVPSQIFMQTVRRVTEQRDIPLIFDEVQTGFGRCGKIFAYELFGIKPDGLTTSKAATGGSGVPSGIIIINGKLAEMYSPNTPFRNGSTHGGNPLACAMNLETFRILSELDNELIGPDAVHRSKYLFDKLHSLIGPDGIVDNVKGIHMMIGLQLKSGYDSDEFKHRLCDNGLFTIAAQNNVVRLLPAANVSYESIDKAIEILHQTAKEMPRKNTIDALVENGPGQLQQGRVLR